MIAYGQILRSESEYEHFGIERVMLQIELD